MTTNHKGIPAGFHSATPYFIVKAPILAAAFYEQAFGASEFHRSTDSSGVVRNIQMQIGDSAIMIGFNPGISEALVNPPRVSTYLFVEDVDAMYAQALAAGATSLYPPEDQDYGNRECGIADPFGIVWWIATPLNNRE